MINDYDKAQRIYRKILYYFEKQIDIHINTSFGYRNGKILDLNEKKLTLVIKDKVLGETPIILEDIYEDSISKFISKEESK